MSETKRPITPRYASLPLISLIIKLMGYLALGFGAALFIVGVIAAIRSKGSVEIIGLFLVQLLATVVAAVLLIAFSELIHVLLDIEENTRRSADIAAGRVTGTTPRAGKETEV